MFGKKRIEELEADLVESQLIRSRMSSNIIQLKEDIDRQDALIVDLTRARKELVQLAKVRKQQLRNAGIEPITLHGVSETNAEDDMNEAIRSGLADEGLLANGTITDEHSYPRRTTTTLVEGGSFEEEEAVDAQVQVTGVTSDATTKKD